MEKLILFLKIIAWCGAVVSTILSGMCVYGTLTYPGSVDEMLDRLKGVKRSYPIWIWLIAAVISWSFIIAF